MDSKKCVNIDQISVIDASKSHDGVRRCRDTNVTSSGSPKRRKLFYFRDQEIIVQSENHCRSEVEFNSPGDVVSSPESGTSDNLLSSPCFNNCVSIDLKVELRVGTETSMSGNDGFSRETRQSPPQAVASRPATAAKTPTAAEIEEFFAAAENNNQKRFSEKYNYDIVNDVPMDGRYQWVRLKP